MLGSNFIKRHKMLQIALIVFVPLLIWYGDHSAKPAHCYSHFRIGYALQEYSRFYAAPLLTIWFFIACYQAWKGSRRKSLAIVLLTVPALSAAVYDIGIFSFMFENVTGFICSILGFDAFIYR